ncbi:bifunctional phosphopantothenoylcysteine decarboxylase/phosphopantothenate--cysteine ligase CoaBC [Mangrovitalea sediminis]|uniref:bifunctional phosphopantothenoylcysteine decarboxylase/phosphopantothenate--cysteine ligase CoaBC n=1 Tax=Mangrovitalea sediminis TaxID=1982043 RepID=UPI000BE52EE3|nr:bifunctional phosphopantothenoylcysteine decarboxylase/phosphopantothenate--cysteine ligase CoaBC [Mangrovitalea sediminis]
MASRQILVGVTGGIAAYKSAELVRLLGKQGHRVIVVMTEGAKAFVTPLTFQALTGSPVRDSLLDPEAEAGMGHIELARWADLVLIAPASADFMARLNAGMADDLLSTLCLATTAPIALAPAMNQAMWSNARTQANLDRLSQDAQIHVWGPAAGDQACGDVGLGRMLEAAELAERVAGFWERPLAGMHWVITAGPTRESIDPVRYISNHSSGKMGYALARAAADAGARVTLVSGPVGLPVPAGVDRVSVESAEQMYEAVHAAVADGGDLFVAAAAVADYRVIDPAAQKIKKSRDRMTIELTRNPDILSSVAALPSPPFTVGFAAETHDVEHYARDKLTRKKLDMIVANDVSDQRIGFNSDVNAVTVIWDGGQQQFPMSAKTQLAEQLLESIMARYQAKP